MKNCLLIMIAGMMICVSLGCNRESQEDPVAWSKDADGQPSAITKPILDYEIIGKPSEVAKRRMTFKEGVDDGSSGGGDSGGSTDPTGPSTPASDEEIAEVKVVLEQVFSAKTDGDDAAVLECVDEAAATALGGMKDDAEGASTQAAALEDALQTKFDAAYPPEVKAAITKMRTDLSALASPSGVMEEVSMDQLIFKKIEEKLVAAGPGDVKYILAKTADGAWKIALDKAKTDKIAALGELTAACLKVVKALEAGVEDTSITADNIAAKTTELIEESVAPAMLKLNPDGADSGVTPVPDPVPPVTDPVTDPDPTPVTDPVVTPVTDPVVTPVPDPTVTPVPDPSTTPVAPGTGGGL